MGRKQRRQKKFKPQPVVDLDGREFGGEGKSKETPQERARRLIKEKRSKK